MKTETDFRSGKIGSIVSGTDLLLRRVNVVAMACLFVIVCLTTVAVFARYVLNRPIPGDNEITELLMVVAIFFGAVAVAQIDKRHVTIDIVLQKLPERARLFTNIMTGILGIILVGLIVWRTAATAIVFAQSGNTTRMMSIPFYPFAMVIPFGCFLLLIAMLRDLVIQFWEARRLYFTKTIWALIPLLTIVLLILVVLWERHFWQIDPLVLGGAGLLFCVFLFVTGMPVSIAMFITGLLGIAYMRGWQPALSFMGESIWRTTANYTFAVAPLFITMGYFILYSDISQDLFNAAYKWLGRMPGGLAVATIAACAAYAAVVGDPFTGTVSLGAIALPEMKKYQYSDSLSTGCICAGSTLGTLIPPSIPLAIYGILTQLSIGTLFIAGIVPGLLMGAAWVLQVYLQCLINPRLGPPGSSSSIGEKIRSLRSVWPVVALFLLVLGGMYGGIFTPTEAGGIGAMGALAIGLFLGRYTRKRFNAGLSEASCLVGMLFFMLAAAKLLGSFFVLSRFPYELSNFLTRFALPPIAVVMLLAVIVIILSCFIDGLVLLLIVVPIFYPVILSLGLDGIWFGVVMVILTNIGALTPPFAINVFAIRAVAKDIPIGTIYLGVLPFMLTGIFMLFLFMFYPQIVTWLPALMTR